MAKRCALYARVSTSDQRVGSQLYDLRQFATRRGFEVISEYTDVTASSPTARRPGLGAMMRDVRKKKFDIVIVAAFVQVARSPKHFLSVMRELNGFGIDFVSLRENIATNDTNGREFYTIPRNLVELETDLIRERIRAGMRRRKLEGLPIGRQLLNVDHESLVSDRLDPATVRTPNRNCALKDLKNFVLNIVEVTRRAETGRRTIIENAKVVVGVKAQRPDASHFAPGGNGKFAQTLSPAYDGGFRCVRHAVNSNHRELVWERLICCGLSPIRSFGRS